MGQARLGLNLCHCSSSRMWLSPTDEMSSVSLLGSELAEGLHVGSETPVGVDGPGKIMIRKG